MTYSKEIPSVLDKVGATFEVLTGKARKNMSVI
jgi:hypothetical protein